MKHFHIPILCALLSACNANAEQSGKVSETKQLIKKDDALIFQFEDIGFAPDCTPNAALERLLHIVTGQPSAAKSPADTELYNAVSGNTLQKIMLDQPADWHGLKLRSISLYAGIQKGPVNYTLYFSDPAKRVLQVWNEQGWNLPAVNKSRAIDPDGYAAIGVQNEEGTGASVTCWRV